MFTESYSIVGLDTTSLYGSLFHTLSLPYPDLFFSHLTLFFLLFMFLKCRYTFSLYPVVICLSPLFSVVLALCLSVSLPGVVHVKLTRPDKDNSLTQSVVCFSPLFFALFHSIPQSSLIHPAVQLHYMVFSFRRLPSICFTPSVFLLWREMYSTQLSVYCVVWSFCHSCLPSSISPSIWLSGSLSIVIRL